MSLLIASWLVAPRSAAACSPGGGSETHALRPQWAPGSGLVLVEESVTLTCDEAGESRQRKNLHCRWQSVHVFERRAELVDGDAQAREGERIPPVMLVPFEQIEVRIGERSFAEYQPLLEPMLAEDGRPADPVARRLEDLGVEIGPWNDGWVELEDPGGERVEVVATGEGTLPSRGRGRFGCRITPMEARHLALAHPRAEVGILFWLAGTEDPNEASSSVRTRVELDMPARWRAWSLADDEEVKVEAGRRRRVARLPVGERRYAMGATRREAPFGGPIIGFGGGLGDYAGFRARLGYEYYFPAIVGYSIAVETDFRDQVMVVPAVEVGHPIHSMLVFLPSLGVGIGAPIQILPDARAGLRGLASLTWPVVSFLFAVDWYPATRSLAQSLGFGLYGQLSF